MLDPVCRCAEGWAGTDCTIRVCRASGECENGGVCSVVSNSAVCTCSEEYDGARCQIARLTTSGSSTGMWVGIGVGCAAAVGVIVAVTVCALHRYRMNQYTKTVNSSLKDNHMANIRGQA